LKLIEPLKKGTVDGVDYPVALYQDDKSVVYDIDGTALRWRWKSDHLSSIHMPNEAARFFVYWSPRHIERVQKISAEDARAEGVDLSYVGKIDDPRGVFRHLWNKINADRGYPWEDDPSVWVYDWKPISAPIEFVLGYPVIEKDYHGN